MSRPEEVQRRTFYLLFCERCGRATTPPKRFNPPDFAAPTTEAMRCIECEEHLHLVECFTAPQTAMWQAAPGATWHHVIYPEALPDSPGRQVWMKP